MCGIFAVIQENSCQEKLLEGLSSLEYRGYDSAGIATQENEGFYRKRAVGKLGVLKEALINDPCLGSSGIGHTRWATHGKATENNAHPHQTENFSVVHNGIIENFSALKKEFFQDTIHFNSDTDTEIIPYLLEFFLEKTNDPLLAFKKVLSLLKGTFALVILYRLKPNTLFVARQGSPLVIGVEKEALYVASDALAFSKWTKKALYLENGDYGTLELKENEPLIRLFDAAHQDVNRFFVPILSLNSPTSKGHYAHFMLKEIFEQPIVFKRHLEQEEKYALKFFPSFKKITLIACGTSYFAGCVARYWFENLCGIPVEVEIASEYRYRNPVIKDDDTLFMVISQSGETIDTLKTLFYLKEKNQKVYALVNAENSSMAREAFSVFPLLAGPEIGVASTKAFTSQLMVFAHLALFNSFKKDQEAISFREALPGFVNTLLQDLLPYQEIGKILSQSKSILYLSRGHLYPIAQEGALKVKELSYIHAEAYAAGELKHGPIALVDRDMPIVALIPYNPWFEKTLSNIHEIAARGAPIICLTDDKGKAIIKENNLPLCHFVTLPSLPTFWEPIAYSVAVQLLAYYAALAKGTDIDQPRNLAKSVTVE